MEFNERLIQLRKEKNYSQEELGNLINVTRQTISNWELGISTPELSKIIELSKVFEISTDELLGVINSKRLESSPPTSSTNLDKKEEQRQVDTNKKLNFNYFKIIWTSVYALICFIGGYLPFLSSFSFYDILFSSYYLNGNVLCLFIALSVLIHVAFSIASIFIAKHSKIFYYASLSSTALTFNMSLLQLFFLSSSFGGIGLMLGFIFHGANFMCTYFIPTLRHSHESQIDGKISNLPFLLADIVLTITLFMTLSFFQHTSPFSILLGVMLILTHLSIALFNFIQNKKTFKNVKLVLSILTFLLYIVLSIKTVLFVMIILLVATCYYVFYYLEAHKVS